LKKGKPEMGEYYNPSETDENMVRSNCLNIDFDQEIASVLETLEFTKAIGITMLNYK
jgi:hypothetical protein